VNKHARSVVVRHEAILALMRDTQVRSQEELLLGLRRQGFKVTQPTLSRDLKTLGVAKSPAGYVASQDLQSLAAGGGELSPAAAREEQLRQSLREFVVSVEQAGSLVVLRTPPAAAQPVARALDASRPEGVAGTLAGDDTVFVAARSAADARRLVAYLGTRMRAGTAARRSPALSMRGDRRRSD
jgi:transcriptional regulator of arginine metabolism